MGSHIRVKATHAVAAERIDEFKKLASEMIDLVAASEPGYSSYEWYLSDDQGTCTILGTLEDSEAVLHHLDNIAEMIGPLSEVAPATGIELYGEVSDELRQAVAPFGAAIAGPFKGFTR